MLSVALIYDHLTRVETTGVYCLRALAEKAKVEQFHPSQLGQIRPEEYDLHLFVDDGLDYEFPEKLHPQAFWAIDTHVDLERACRRASNVDFIFAAQKNGAVRLSERLGRNVEWLPLACDPTIHARQNVEASTNLSFVGNLIGRERVRLVQLLQSELFDVHVGRHYFEEMAAIYSASRIVFNRSVADEVNMRVFEGLCSGSLLVTNDLAQNGQAELFQNEKHLITYESDEELLDKIRFYLKNDAARMRIAAAGRREVNEFHTYRHRIERILDAASKAPRVSSSGAPIGSKLGQDSDYFQYRRPELLALIPRDAGKILDIGCGAGHLGEAIKKRQPCVVYGVEVNDTAARRSQLRLDQVWNGDVETIDLNLPPESLDVIVCGDVLEHLQRPQELLRRLRAMLRPDGQLIASVPNVSHHSILSSLLAGNWTYESAGLLDETHLRFFTLREAEKLLFRAGLRIDRTEVVRGPGDDSRALHGSNSEIRLNGLPLWNLPPSCVDRLTAYQYLIVASPDAERWQPPGLTSIVLVTNNQLDYTKLCLASIRLRTDEPYEVIVVDNGSTDETRDYLSRLDGVRLIPNDNNRGFPAAANQGINAAHGEYILLLNNDCIVTTGWLSRLLLAVNSDPKVGLVGPCSNNVSGIQKVSIDYEQLSDLDGFAWERAKSHEGIRTSTDRLVGFCLLFKRAVLDRVGLLDERFGIGNYEDDDFCRRALNAGFQAVIAEDAFVHHFGSVTFRANGVDYSSLMAHNRRQFQEKWNQLPANEETLLVDQQPDVREKNQLVGELGLQANGDRPRLSLCMIVRDSAKTLNACLESIRPWVDEMIVVDTGSLDATPAIAQKYGAKVFRFPWCDDFAAARNESLSHATGEWLFWMDSDDTIDETNGRKLRELVNGFHRTEVVGYVAQVHCPHEQGGEDFTAVDHVKLFRNLPTMRFEGRIHEQILPAINRLSGEVAWTDIFVVHSGSDHSEEGQAKKLERDLKLLKLEESEQPDHPFTLFNLGMTHLEMKRGEQAAHYLERTIAVAGPQESHVPKAFSLLIQALSDLGRREEAWQRCEAAIARYPDDPELSFRAGVLAHHFDRHEEAERFYLKNLGRLPEKKFRSIDHGILGYKTRQNLACLYDEVGRHRDAEEQWRVILTERPNHATAWTGLMQSLLRRGEVNAARELVQSNNFSRQSPTLRMQLEASIEEAVGDVMNARRILETAITDFPDQLELRDALCKLLFEHGPLDEAEAALEALTERFADNGAGFCNLGTLYLRQGRYSAAAESFERSLTLRPNWRPAYEHLADCYERLGRHEEAHFAQTKARRLPHARFGTHDGLPTINTAKPWFRSAHELQKAVEACLQAAERGESKLSPDALTVHGMTSRPIRHLLNCLGGMPGCRFLEVGTFYGATLVAASFDNQGVYASVDDFSEFNEPDPRPLLRANLACFSDHCHVDFREEECRTTAQRLPSQSVNVYFYDGEHTRDAHRDALLSIAHALSDPFVLLVDDWNLELAREGTQAALEQLGWSLQHKWERQTSMNGDDATWWNGLLIAVVTKSKQPRGSSQFSPQRMAVTT